MKDVTIEERLAWIDRQIKHASELSSGFLEWIKPLEDIRATLVAAQTHVLQKKPIEGWIISQVVIWPVHRYMAALYNLDDKRTVTAYGDTVLEAINAAVEVAAISDQAIMKRKEGTYV